MKTNNYDWEEILKYIKEFTNVEDISDIIIIGTNKGVRRINIE